MSDDDLNDAIARQHQWEAAESRRSWKKLADDYERIFGRPSTTPAGSPCSCDYHKHMTRAARMRDESPFERERADYDGACEVCGRPSSSQWCARCSEDA